MSPSRGHRRLIDALAEHRRRVQRRYLGMNRTGFDGGSVSW